MKWLDIEQNTDEWFNARLGKITSSQFAKIISNNNTSNDYALQLALERINKKKSVNQIKTTHMERGHRQEPIAISLYESTHFTIVKRGGFFDCGFYGDSPDGLVGTDGTVEVKSVIQQVHYATLLRDSYDPSYHWQIVGHLACSGRYWCDFISYCADFPINNQILVYRVERDTVKEDIKVLMERLDLFDEIVEKTKQQIIDLLSRK